MPTAQPSTKRPRKPAPNAKPRLAPSEVLACANPEKAKPRKKQAAGDAVRKKEALQLVADRLRKARELNGLSLQEAASRLGFAAAASVSKLETARHITEIPLWFLMEASRVYEVSGDYLLGLTDELGLQPRVQFDREVSTWLNAALERNRARDLQALTVLHQEIVCALTTQRELTIAIQEIEQALEIFTTLNPRFKSDMKGSARLAYAVDTGMSLSARMAAQLSKFKGMMHASRNQTGVQSALQMDLLTGDAS